ncbi:MAG TPA: prolyl oligopeptidase family serine peptidase, partial [Polyangiaceae bacterium]|nr:prolyl oligopeptidase family serine peptidase [Polyangiaceae bacterium]
MMRRFLIFSAPPVAASVLACATPLEVRSTTLPEPDSKTPTMAEQPKKQSYPATALLPVTDEYFGVKVVDEYRWLEEAKSPEVQQWNATQQEFTRAHLDKIPGRDAIAQRVSELLASPSATYFGLTVRGNTLFAMKDAPPKQQPFLVTLRSAEDLSAERTLLDPAVLDASGGTTIDFYVPSKDGKKVAVSLSQGGTESGSVHVFDVQTGKEIGDVVPRVQGGTAGGSVAWNGAGTGFWYTRYPHPGERPQSDLDFYQDVWFHKLGTSLERDHRELGDDFPRIAETALSSSPDGRYVLASVANGDGGEFAHYLRATAEGSKWQKISAFADKVVDIEFALDGTLYLISNDRAPRGKILRLDPRNPILTAAEIVVPESDAVIQHVEATKSRLYVLDMMGGPSQLRVFDVSKPGPAQALPNVPIPPISAVNELRHIGDDDVLFQNQSYTEPSAWFHFSGKDGQAARTALVETSPASFADAEVERTMCVSKDGTLVPINLMRRKGTPKDGSNPTLLYGYGGYSISLTPRFQAIRRLWLDHGGVWAVANLRGGGEFGEDWHRAGNLTNKQNVFDDFAACAEHLIRTGVTNPAKLAIMGGSNGGLLVGAALVQ